MAALFRAQGWGAAAGAALERPAEAPERAAAALGAGRATSWAPAAAAQRPGRSAPPRPARDRAAAGEAVGGGGGGRRARAAQRGRPGGPDVAGAAGRGAAREDAQPRRHGEESGEADGLGHHSNRRACQRSVQAKETAVGALCTGGLLQCTGGLILGASTRL